MKLLAYLVLFIAVDAFPASGHDGVRKRQMPGNATITQLLLGPWSAGLKDRTGGKGQLTKIIVLKAHGFQYSNNGRAVQICATQGS
jgi:hypothetical protein